MATQLEVEKGTIERIYNYGIGPVDHDYEDKRIPPGFTNIRTHGAYDFDINDGEPGGLRNWMKCIPEERIASVPPTTVTQTPEVLTKAVINVAAAVEEGYEGAEILGIHFEGPFLDMEYRGARSPEVIVTVSVEQPKRYQTAAGELIKYIILAPERDPDHALTKYRPIHDVVANMGHFAAIYEQALLGTTNGATLITHVYNGMTPYHRHKPGLVGTILGVGDIHGEIICDGCHFHLTVLNNFFYPKGRDYSIVISDLLRAKRCLPGGQYQLEGYDVEIGDDGLTRLRGSDIIARGTLNVNRGPRILMEGVMVPFNAATSSCTIDLTGCLEVDKRKGRITAGCDGGLVVLDDDYSVIQTWCRERAIL